MATRLVHFSSQSDASTSQCGNSIGPLLVSVQHFSRTGYQLDWTASQVNPTLLQYRVTTRLDSFKRQSVTSSGQESNHLTTHHDIVSPNFKRNKAMSATALAEYLANIHLPAQAKECTSCVSSLKWVVAQPNSQTKTRFREPRPV